MATITAGEGLVLEPSGNCKYCGKSTDEGISLHGDSHLYLEEDERAHMECYIRHCVRLELDRAI